MSGSGLYEPNCWIHFVEQGVQISYMMSSLAFESVLLTVGMFQLSPVPEKLGLSLSVNICTKPGKFYWRGRLGTIDLLMLTGLDLLLFMLKNYLPFLQNKLPL
jgi:hypothetical protein